MRWRYVIPVTLGLLLFCLAAISLFFLPRFSSQIFWHVESMRARIQRLIYPPEKALFLPQEQLSASTVEAIASATLSLRSATNIAMPSAAVASIEKTQTGTETPLPSMTSSATLTPPITSIPMPEKITLPGINHEYQLFNNCGPANLAMALSYWNWKGDQRDTRAYLRPNLDIDDKNVAPSEMVSYVENQTELEAIYRVGGSLESLKSFIAAGFPVLIEAGHHPPDDWWMGHYMLINGYDDNREVFISQDSLISPDLPVSYEDLEKKWWRDFNYVYLVIYPTERESEVFNLLGSNLDPKSNFQQAAQKANHEITFLSGRDLFFAWFNLGSNLVGLEDYFAAAQAFDKAFNIYQTLSEEMRPYRLMWYQTGPYQAYYNSGRYQDVIDLANVTFTWVGKPTLEESYYWRGLAYAALGNFYQAQSDLNKAVQLNPNFSAAFEALDNLGYPSP
jgi:hypothetical protein